MAKQKAGNTAAQAVNNAVQAAAGAPPCKNAKASHTVMLATKCLGKGNSVINPKVPGTASYTRFAKALHGQTVAANLAVAGGITSADIRWGITHNQLTLVAPTVAQ